MRLTLTALIALGAVGCGKEDSSAPPRNPGGAGRDGGPGAGSGAPDASPASDAGLPACLESGGAGVVTRLDGERVTGTVEGLFTAGAVEPTTEGATTTLQFEVVGGDFDIDAGTGGDEEYRVELIMTALPRNHVRAGDVLSIVWNGGTEGAPSTLIVLRDEALLFFAARAHPERRDGESLLPALETYGIAIGTGDMTCEGTTTSCNFREYALRVTSGDQTATVSQTGLARAGDLTVAGRVLERLPSDAECFLAENTLIAAGFTNRP